MLPEQEGEISKPAYLKTLPRLNRLINVVNVHPAGLLDAWLGEGIG